MKKKTPLLVELRKNQKYKKQGILQNLIMKRSLMLNTIRSTIRKKKSGHHISEQCRTLRTSCMRGSVDDRNRKDRTFRARDPSEPHVTCSRVWSGVRGQELNQPAYLTSSS